MGGGVRRNRLDHPARARELLALPESKHAVGCSIVLCGGIGEGADVLELQEGIEGEVWIVLSQPVGQDAPRHLLGLVSVREFTEEPPESAVPIDLEMGWRKESLRVPALRLPHREAQDQ